MSTQNNQYRNSESDRRKSQNKHRQKNMVSSLAGILVGWPWKYLGNYKYLILAPWVVHSIYSYITKGEERDFANLIVFPLLIWRWIHNQMWSTFSRHRTAKGNNLLVEKGLEFEQVDAEKDWDDQIIFTASDLPWWRLDGGVIIMLTHAGPVEFLYYWIHRAFHHGSLYTTFHAVHHAPAHNEPRTAWTHTFAENLVFYGLFFMAIGSALVTRTLSIGSFTLYITYVDYMSVLGHCNFEFVPRRLFTIFPPLKFHTIHHTKYRTNYCLFMPFYDYIYGTWDESSDSFYLAAIKKAEEPPVMVHLTHLTTLESIYHLRLGLSSFSTTPLASKWYLKAMWPITLSSMSLTWIYGKIFAIETNTFEKLKFQTWCIPRYNIHYSMPWQREGINHFIEEAILEAQDKGIKVLSLGLLNQGEELNRNGEDYIEKYPKLKVKLVDGSSLAAAVVLNSIPKGTTEVFFSRKLPKVAYAIATSLCHQGVQVVTSSKDQYEKLKAKLAPEDRRNLLLTKQVIQKVWLVGEDLTKNEQLGAIKGTIFIPFSQFPPIEVRKDCFYLNTPAMVAPKSFRNLHSCENWLPRRVISAWRIAGILHALEGWDAHECGDKMFDVNKIWEAALQHGFLPVPATSLGRSKQMCPC
ncbi:Very-long-chain aldehyde decarbonylase CER1-like protein [Drosera capensis]